MKYRVLTARRALSDISKAHFYIAVELRAHQAADNLINELERRINELETMPGSYAPAADERLARLGIRAMPVSNYLVFYRMDEQAKTVTVIRVLYARSDWDHLL